MMIVPIQKLNDSAVLPSVAHEGDAGMDIFASETVEIAPSARIAVPTGIAMAVPQGFVALVWDKSGRALNDGLKTMAGVIDSGYRGEVKIVVLNTADTLVTIHAGEKIAQILIQSVETPIITEVESLDDTERGSGGFGSTGL